MSDNIIEISLPEKFNKTKKNLIVLDACINLINQTVIASFYSQERHSNCDALYLSQLFLDFK
jgi:hypothetical protein